MPGADFQSRAKGGTALCRIVKIAVGVTVKGVAIQRRTSPADFVKRSYVVGASMAHQSGSCFIAAGRPFESQRQTLRSLVFQRQPIRPRRSVFATIAALQRFPPLTWATAPMRVLKRSFQTLFQVTSCLCQWRCQGLWGGFERSPYLRLFGHAD